MNETLGLHTPPQATRLAYSPPTLRLVGDVRELTAGGSGVVAENNPMCGNGNSMEMC